MKLYDISSWPKNGLNVTDYPYIGAVDISADDYEFGMPIAIGEDHYAVSVLNREKGAVGARKIRMSNPPEERNYENNIICPYCGYEDCDSWECADSDDEHECGCCGGIFRYERVVTVEYNSYPKDPPEAMHGNWIKEARDD